MQFSADDCYIREQDPLKQGLKLHGIPAHIIRVPIREQDPLKQGLKHSTMGTFLLEVPPIREQDPLKQGLKLR